MMLSLLSVGGTASPSEAATTPQGGSHFTTLGCSAWKQGGLVHNGTENPNDVAYYNAVQIRSCLRHSGRTLYGRTEWYLPNGGYHVGVIYADVQDCGTGKYGSYRLTEHPNKYYGPRTAGTSDKTSSNNDYGTAGHSYRAKGYISGSVTTPARTYNMADGPQKPNVNVRTGCYRI